MAKFKVRNHRMIVYPNGDLRGEAGYVVDGDKPYERDTIQDQGDALQRVGRQTPASFVDLSRLLPDKVDKAPAKKKAAKKKATKKKATKKKSD